ncbi:uncharacterized protein TNCV_4056721 [Trichonephila clavipes]|nr:uncharacterized protein TNCV_4056721 [Trichonephila clavipes]
MCIQLKERRFFLGTFRSERMRVLNRSCQNDRLRVMLVLVHIDITPPHTPLPVFRRIGERTIPYSWRCITYHTHVLLECLSLKLTFSRPTLNGGYDTRLVIKWVRSGKVHWCAKIKDEVEKLAYQLNEEAERTKDQPGD